MARLEEWEELQEYTKDVFELIDPPAKVQIGSGGPKGNGDVISSQLMAECKQRTRKNIIIAQEWWNKIKEEAELLDRIPVVVCKNESGEIIISMKLDDFSDFVQGVGGK